MVESRFDVVTRKFAESTDRRSMLKLVISSFAAGFALNVRSNHGEAASRLRADGETCRKDSDCVNGTCAVDPVSGRRRCTCETAACLCGPLADEGALRCIANHTGFCTVDHGAWVVRACAQGTTCVQTSETAIVCEFPQS